MRTGLWLDDQHSTVDDLAAQAREAAGLGYETVWLSQRDGWDVLTLLAAVGQAAPAIGLGTSIVTTYPRHPLTLAAQALSVQAATAERLTLGVGVGHAVSVEGQYGSSFAQPARHLREHLTALQPLLRGEEVAYHGRTLTAVGQVSVAASPPPVLVAALGPRMLAVAGELAGGTITTWALERALGEHVVPSIVAAARRAGRPDPEVVAGVCVSVTSDPAGARQHVDAHFGRAADLPAYRAVLDREGVRTPGDVVVAGDEQAVSRAFGRLADAGATALEVIPVGTPEDRARTVASVPGLVAG